MKSIKTAIAAIATLASTIAFGGGLYLVANSDFNMPSLVFKMNVQTTEPREVLRGNESSLMVKIDDGTILTNIVNQPLYHAFARTGEHVIKVYSRSPNTMVRLPSDAATEVPKLRPLKIGKYRQLLVAPPCTNSPTLTTVYIPEGADRIQYETYKYSYNLRKVVLPSTVIWIDGHAFRGCSNLVDMVFNDGLKRIGGNSFQDCTGLQNLVIPESVTNIGVLAFCNCTNLNSIKISSSVKNLRKQLLYGAKNLEHIEFSPELEHIDDYVFFHNDKMKEFNIPTSVTNIGICAFQACAILGKVTMGNPEIGNGAFLSCNAITNIVTTMPVQKAQDNAKDVWKVRSGCVINCSDGDFTVP